jgi:hypothetical protein
VCVAFDVRSLSGRGVALLPCVDSLMPRSPLVSLFAMSSVSAEVLFIIPMFWRRASWRRELATIALPLGFTYISSTLVGECKPHEQAAIPAEKAARSTEPPPRRLRQDP